MKKWSVVKSKFSNKSLLQSTSMEGQIAMLYLHIKKESGNIFHLEEPLLSKQEEMLIINYILHKRLKTKEDREVLIEYLKSLANFMSIISLDTSPELLNEMLYRVSKSLSLQESPGNTFLFRTGEKGATFYIIFKGSVSVLIPKEIKVQLSLEEYLTHLCFLHQMEEYTLQEKTVLSNIALYDINLANPTKPQVRNLANKSLESYTPKECSYASLEEYLACLVPESATQHSPFLPSLSLWVYHKVAVLTQGNTFGETALMSKNSLRTATIFITEDTSFGILNELEFRISLKNNQLQTKKERISFVMSFSLFNQLNHELFLSKYWNYFTFIKLEQNEVLFHQNTKREVIYLLKDGEIELCAYLSMNSINKILRQFGDKSRNEAGKYSYNTAKRMKITTMKHKTILGLDDLVYGNDQLFCTATCLSKKAELFMVNYRMMQEIIEFSHRHQVLAGLIKEKVSLMVTHLRAFQQVDSFCLEKEPYSVIKAKVLPVFNTRPLTTRARAKKTLMTKTTLNSQPITVDQSKQQQPKKYMPMTTYQCLPSPYSNTMRETMNTEGNQRNSMPYPNRLGTAKNSHMRRVLNIDIDSAIAHGKEKEKSKFLTERTWRRDTMRTALMKEAKSSKRLLKLSPGETEDSEGNDSNKLSQIANRIKASCPKKKMIYSNLVLQSDYTLSNTYDIGNMMDFCLMEEDKQEAWTTTSLFRVNTPKANYSARGSITGKGMAIALKTKQRNSIPFTKPFKRTSPFFSASGQ